MRGYRKFVAALVVAGTPIVVACQPPPTTTTTTTTSSTVVTTTTTESPSTTTTAPTTTTTTAPADTSHPVFNYGDSVEVTTYYRDGTPSVFPGPLTFISDTPTDMYIEYNRTATPGWQAEDITPAIATDTQDGEEQTVVASIGANDASTITMLGGDGLTGTDIQQFYDMVDAVGDEDCLVMALPASASNIPWSSWGTSIAQASQYLRTAAQTHPRHVIVDMQQWVNANEGFMSDDDGIHLEPTNAADNTFDGKFHPTLPAAADSRQAFILDNGVRACEEMFATAA